MPWGDVPVPSTTINLIGTGAQSGAAIGEKFRLRVDSGFISASVWRVDTKGSQAGALRKRFSSSMIDYYPAGGGFHLSLGGRLDNRKKSARSAGLANVLLYAVEPTRRRNQPSGFKRFSPAMTAGFGQWISEDITLGIEAGALVARGNPATREFARFAGIGSRNDRRFPISGGPRLNPVAQVSFAFRL